MTLILIPPIKASMANIGKCFRSNIGRMRGYSKRKTPTIMASKPPRLPVAYQASPVGHNHQPHAVLTYIMPYNELMTAIEMIAAALLGSSTGQECNVRVLPAS